MDLYSDTDKTELKVYNVLKEIIDPELAVNIVDLGLIYNIKYDEITGIHIRMTLSSKGCPMGDVIANNMDELLNERFPDCKHHIELVWEPVWSSEFVTPEGRKKLGLA